MISKGSLVIKQEWEAWMNLENPDKTIEEAVEELKALGNDILEVDKENRRIKVMYVNSEDK